VDISGPYFLKLTIFNYDLIHNHYWQSKENNIHTLDARLIDKIAPKIKQILSFTSYDLFST